MGEQAQAPTSRREPTKRQAALAAAILDPKVMSKAKAGEIAGYSHPNATYLALGSVGTQTALARLKMRRTDKARDLKEKALTVALKRIDDPEVRDEIVGGYAKLGHEISRDEPEPEGISDQARIAARRKYGRRCWRKGITWLAARLEIPQDVVVQALSESAFIEKG